VACSPGKFLKFGSLKQHFLHSDITFSINSVIDQNTGMLAHWILIKILACVIAQIRARILSRQLP
jgi:hypothetical protein